MKPKIKPGKGCRVCGGIFFVHPPSKMKQTACCSDECRAIYLKTQQNGYRHGECVGGTSSLYWRWSGMISRCHCKTQSSYKYYGAKGVTVCKEWKNSFEAFRAWAMTSGFRAELQIDRIDSKLGYSPENCRWSTAPEQCRNRASNKIVTANGESMCITDWNTRLGASRGTISGRIRNGWNEVDAVTTPVRKLKKGAKK